MQQELAMILSAELTKRSKKNPRYSLRAFARSLDIEPSALSKFIRGKRHPTARVLDRICNNLPIDAKELKASSSNSKVTYLPLQKDKTEIISNWRHYAILELTRLYKSMPSVRQIATLLDIPEMEAKSMIDRLQRNGMLQIRSGKWKDVSGTVTTIGSEISLVALKKMQQELLDAAKKALDTTPLRFRNQSAMTFAFNSKQLEQANHKIARFRRSFARWADRQKTPNSIYQITISFFPIVSSNKKRSKS